MHVLPFVNSLYSLQVQALRGYSPPMIRQLANENMHPLTTNLWG